MATSVTKSIQIFDSGTTASSWSPTISAGDINNLASTVIPDYAIITNATLTLDAKKTFSLAKGNINVYIGGTNVHSASKAVTSDGNYSPTIDIKNYIYSGGTNAGNISGDVKISLDTSGGSTWWDLRNVCINYTYYLPEYTVTWKNGDTVLETDTGVTVGTVPTYNGATPIKTATAEYSYTFNGWKPAVGAITSDTTYEAQFSSTKRQYTVTTVASPSDGGTVTKEPNQSSYEYGSSVTLKADAGDIYKFIAWNDGVTNASRTITITGDITYTAYFKLNAIFIDTSQSAGVFIDTTEADEIYMDTTKVYG